MSYEHRIGSIGTLGIPVSPSTVGGGVVAIVVNSIKAVLGGRSATHISEKGGKASPPAVHGYASAAVSVVGVVIRVITPVTHIAPCPVLREVSLSVLKCVKCVCFCSETPAGLCASISDVTEFNIPHSPAVTSKGTPVSFPTQPYKVNDSKSVKFSTWGYNNFSHHLDSIKLVVRGLGVSAPSPRIISQGVF